MTTAPLDPPTEHDELAARLAYAEEHFARADAAYEALGRLRGAYAALDEALKHADTTVNRLRTYDPTLPDHREDRPLMPADLRIPARVTRFVTHNAEEFLEADVMLAAMHASLREHAERIETDVQAIINELRAAKEGAA